MSRTIAAEHYRTLFERSPGANLILDPDLTIVAVSDAYLDATMTERAAIVGRALFEVFPDNPDDPTADGTRQLRASLERALASGRTDVMPDQKYDIRQPDGRFETRYWSPVNTPVLDDEGRARLLIHHVEDVTPRRAMQEALRRREAENDAREHVVDAVFDASPDAISVVDARLHVTEVSRAVTEVLGVEASARLGKRYVEAVHQDDRDELEHQLRALISEGAERVLQRRYRARHPDGHDVSIEGRARVVKNDAGEPVGAVIVDRDVSETVRTETALSGSLSTIQGILDSALDTVAILDPELRVTSVNYEVADLTGHAVTDIRDAVAFRDVHPEDKPAVLDAFTVLFEHGTNANVRYRNQHVDGRWLTVEVKARAVRDADGRVAQAVLVARDVSDTVALEFALRSAKVEADRANRAKSDFLSRMSHELRTPLNSVLGFTQILQREERLAGQDESLEYIYRAGSHLLDLINEVLDISRIEAGALNVSIESLSIADLTAECLALVAPQAAEAGVRLVNDLGASSYVRADQQRTRQVLLNILSNAIKYNRARGEVRVRADERAGWLRVAIHDTGPGIEAAHFDALFEPFQRLDAEHGDVEGTGLGLALSRRLVEVMGGEMGVESVLGEGSTFWIDLPLSSEPEVAFTRGEVDAVTPAGLAPKSLLYVEDNPANLRLVERLLSNRREITVLHAMKGTLGLELARQHQPDLVLLDLHLPDMTGQSLMERLRGDPLTSSIPVVVLSADATPGQIRRLLASGATDYLSKPLDVNAFFDVVNRFLKDPYDADAERT